MPSRISAWCSWVSNTLGLTPAWFKLRLPLIILAWVALAVYFGERVGEGRPSEMGGVEVLYEKSIEQANNGDYFQIAPGMSFTSIPCPYPAGFYLSSVGTQVLRVFRPGFRADITVLKWMEYLYFAGAIFVFGLPAVRLPLFLGALCALGHGFEHEFLYVDTYARWGPSLAVVVLLVFLFSAFLPRPNRWGYHIPLALASGWLVGWLKLWRHDSGSIAILVVAAVGAMLALDLLITWLSGRGSRPAPQPAEHEPVEALVAEVCAKSDRQGRLRPDPVRYKLETLALLFVFLVGMSLPFWVVQAHLALHESVSGVAHSIDGGTNNFAFYHSLYAGLGSVPNRFDIVWNDEVAALHANQERAGLVYCSPEYMQVLKFLTIETLREEPALLLRNLRFKAQAFVGVIEHPVFAFASLASLVIFLLFYSSWRRVSGMSWAPIVLVLCLVASSASFMAVVPARAYGLAFLLTLALGPLLLFHCAGEIWTRLRSLWRTLRTRYRPIQPTLGDTPLAEIRSSALEPAGIQIHSLTLAVLLTIGGGGAVGVALMVSSARAAADSFAGELTKESGQQLWARWAHDQHRFRAAFHRLPQEPRQRLSRYVTSRFGEASGGGRLERTADGPLELLSVTLVERWAVVLVQAREDRAELGHIHLRVAGQENLDALYARTQLPSRVDWSCTKGDVFFFVFPLRSVPESGVIEALHVYYDRAPWHLAQAGDAVLMGRAVDLGQVPESRADFAE